MKKFRFFLMVALLCCSSITVFGQNNSKSDFAKKALDAHEQKIVYRAQLAQDVIGWHMGAEYSLRRMSTLGATPATKHGVHFLGGYRFTKRWYLGGIAGVDVTTPFSIVEDEFVMDEYNYEIDRDDKIYGVLMADAIKSGVNTFATEWAFQYATVQSSLENTYERFGVLDADIIPSGSCGENARWEYNAKTGELKILGRGAMTGFSSLWSPWYSYRSDIKTVTIADGITEIGDYAFYDCSSLKNIIFLPENPVILGLSVFRYSPLEAIYVPASALDAYKSHEDWAEYKDIIFPIEGTELPIISFGEYKVRTGKTVSVDISIEGNPGIAVTSITLDYDKTALTLKSVENGEIFGSGKADTSLY